MKNFIFIKSDIFFMIVVFTYTSCLAFHIYRVIKKN